MKLYHGSSSCTAPHLLRCALFEMFQNNKISCYHISCINLIRKFMLYNSQLCKLHLHYTQLKKITVRLWRIYIVELHLCKFSMKTILRLSVYSLEVMVVENCIIYLKPIPVQNIRRMSSRLHIGCIGSDSLHEGSILWQERYSPRAVLK